MTKCRNPLYKNTCNCGAGDKFGIPHSSSCIFWSKIVTPTHIPTGNYFSLSQIATIKQVTRRTVQQWIDKGWLKSIQIDGMGHLIEENELKNLTRPKPGRKAKNSL